VHSRTYTSPSESLVKAALKCDSATDASENLSLVYDELRRVAAIYIRRERRGHTLQPTALLHEAFVRLAGRKRGGWATQRDFQAAVAQAMRRVLVDYARARHSSKRGGVTGVRCSFQDLDLVSSPDDVDVLALDEALKRLNEVAPRPGKVVELRYFGGLSVEETSEMLGLSERAVAGDWQFARAWLEKALRDE
jgi:RNA polymerase sigma-70 factor (ECF subfamily)